MEAYKSEDIWRKKQLEWISIDYISEITMLWRGLYLTQTAKVPGNEDGVEPQESVLYPWRMRGPMVHVTRPKDLQWAVLPTLYVKVSRDSTHFHNLFYKYCGNI